MKLTTEEIARQLAEKAGTSDVPDVYATAAAEWILDLEQRLAAVQLAIWTDEHGHRVRICHD